MATLDQFLRDVGATDLVDRAQHFKKHSVGNGRFQIASDRNQSVALVAQAGQLSVLFGLGDRNFAPLSINFDSAGNADRVSAPNANLGRSGETRFRADAEVMRAVTTAASSMKSGNGGSTGLYAAALARAAGAPTPAGRTDWGPGKIETARDIDTATRGGSMNAVAAVVQKWQQHIVFK